MKCDNKHCTNVAVYSASNNKWQFHIQVCSEHLRDLMENFGDQDWDIIAKIQ